MKQCPKCRKLKDIKCFGKDKKAKDGLYYWCRECNNTYTKEWLRKNYLRNPKKYREKRKKWILENPERRKEIDKKHKLKIRKQVLEHYGGKCACCGENEIKFLSIDHIDGGGNISRKKHGFGNTFYRYLKKNNYPKEYQVLCHNCNLAKGFYGKCPHQENKRYL